MGNMVALDSVLDFPSPKGLAAPVFESDGIQDVTTLSPHLSHSRHIYCQLEEPTFGSLHCLVA